MTVHSSQPDDVCGDTHRHPTLHKLIARVNNDSDAEPGTTRVGLVGTVGSSGIPCALRSWTHSRPDCDRRNLSALSLRSAPSRRLAGEWRQTRLSPVALAPRFTSEEPAHV